MRVVGSSCHGVLTTISSIRVTVFQTLKKALMERFAMEDMGSVSLVLGMQITRDRAEGKLKSARKRLSNPSGSDSACPNVILFTRPERARSYQ